MHRTVFGRTVWLDGERYPRAVNRAAIAASLCPSAKSVQISCSISAARGSAARLFTGTGTSKVVVSPPRHMIRTWVWARATRCKATLSIRQRSSAFRCGCERAGANHVVIPFTNLGSEAALRLDIPAQRAVIADGARIDALATDQTADLAACRGSGVGAWVEQRHHGASLSHRKQREPEA